jgi:hypothetical protein
MRVYYDSDCDINMLKSKKVAIIGYGSQGVPIATFDTLMAYLPTAHPVVQAVALAALAGVVVFAFLHFRTLIWNIRQYGMWKRTPAYEKLRNSNAETQLMAIPLAYAMSINVAFILGALFVPGLWNIVEYLFPFSIAAFALVGIYGVRIFLDFFTRVLVTGGFDVTRNNSFGQMIPIFALAMIGVGFSAPAAMTHNPVTSAIAIMLSMAFIIGALLLGVMKIVLGFSAMLEHSAERETVPTLWIIIPITTVVGIALYRINMALTHNFGAEWAAGNMFLFLTTLFSIQIAFGVLGYAVMQRFEYFKHFISGEGRSNGSLALICPGVALFVFANFVINAGLVNIGVVEKHSIAYAILYLPLVYLQFITMRVYFKLNGKLLGDKHSTPSANLAPAE